jgi:hypothetical protein
MGLFPPTRNGASPCNDPSLDKMVVPHEIHEIHIKSNYHVSGGIPKTKGFNTKNQGFQYSNPGDFLGRFPTWMVYNKKSY